MNEIKKEAESLHKMWTTFAADEQLSEHQVAQFKRYMALLAEWNAVTNITRIVEPADVIALHFRDSLALAHARDLTNCKGLCDVGSGGGFPGVPLAIRYPEVPVILLEVNKKKCLFLSAVIQELGLSSCQVVSEDFRTFVRGTDHAIDYFIARASVHPDELVRIFTSAQYQRAEVVYWASRHWEPAAPEKRFIVERYAYDLDDQQRFLIFFKRSE